MPAAVLAAGLLAAVSVAAVVAFRALPGGSPPAAPTPGASASAAARVLAASPPAAPEALPDLPVGAATLVYAGCLTGCPRLLLLGDGRQFQVPARPEDGGLPATLLSLSPNGRWLAYPQGRGMVVRDLTGTGSLEFPASRPDRRTTAWAWSADGAWLLVGEAGGRGTPAYSLVDMRSGAVAAAPVPAGREPVAVGADGGVVTRAAGPGAGPVTRLALAVTPRPGGGAHAMTVDAATVLAGGESLVPGPVLPGAGDGYAIEVRGADGTTTAVLRVGVDGRILERVDAVGADLVGTAGTDLLLARTAAATTVVAVGGGASREVVRLPAGAVVAARGTPHRDA